MVGKVITEELNINNLEAGVIAVLKEDDSLQIVTIQHIDPNGHWVVMGKEFDNYAVPLKAELCKLMVIDKKGTYPLKFNQWSNAIRNKEVNTDTLVNFELVSPKFKEGKYVRICTDCTAQFIGSRNQASCKVCCAADKTAKIIISKESVKPKRPRMISHIKAKEIAMKAYEMGQKSHLVKDVNAWLEKQF